MVLVVVVNGGPAAHRLRRVPMRARHIRQAFPTMTSNLIKWQQNQQRKGEFIFLQVLAFVKDSIVQFVGQTKATEMQIFVKT